VPSSFIECCLPSPADRPPCGSNWIHEIKHDGYRLMARRDSVGIRLLTAFRVCRTHIQARLKCAEPGSGANLIAPEVPEPVG
jgi:hypothetical protein